MTHDPQSGVKWWAIPLLPVVIPVWLALFGVLMVAAMCGVHRMDDSDPHSGYGA